MSVEAATRKSFADLHDAEAFFHAVCNERAADAEALAKVLEKRYGTQTRVRVLDFGGGDGQLTKQLFQHWHLPSDMIQLSVVDLDSTYAENYTSSLQPLTNHRIERYSESPVHEKCDIILASHVLYYVPSLAEWFHNASLMLAPRGICCATMGSSQTEMGKLWDSLFASANLKIPHLGSDDLHAELEARGLDFQVHPVSFRIGFKNSEANRAQFLRFLLGEHAKRLHPSSGPSLDRFVINDRFVANHTDLIYLISMDRDRARHNAHY